MPRSTDILIVGGGIAGLYCALKLAPRPVTVITAAPIGEGASTAWAQGGIAAAVAEGDTPEAHARDTIAAGAGLVDEAVTLGMVREAPARVRDLLGYGVPFDSDLAGHLDVALEAAHSARRVVHVRGDLAGQAIMQALVAAVRRTPSISVLEGSLAEDLILRDGRVVGVRTAEASGIVERPAGAVVLATGGIGHLYAVTTNPPEAAGLGLAIAARAGAVVADCEFVQFHPTAIAIDRDPAPLASEAIRGEGAFLVNREGERFMLRLDPQAELAPRDVVARGVFAEIAGGRGAFLDARSAIGPAFPERFPTVYASCMAAGINPVRDLIPVAPAAHYHMGGVATDARGRTSVEGLWAAGEVASTGVHGANRLASNSLLEALVFAGRIAADLKQSTAEASASDPSMVRASGDRAADPAIERDLRAQMSRDVGVIRDHAGLALALRRLSQLECEPLAPTLRNMATAALIVTASALMRRESRGAHFRSDFPRSDDSRARRNMLTLAEARVIAREATERIRAEAT